MPAFAKSLKAEQLTEELLVTVPRSRNAFGLCVLCFNVNKHYAVDQKNYGTSKLCNVWTAGALARKYKDKGIKAFSLHPGSLIATSKLKCNLQTGTIIQL
jgi:NAD(P)-dependent dehydrogenase (short-subunit alcohol dehydrogenase family)